MVFVLDASYSVTWHNFQLMKVFVKNFLYDSDIDGGFVKVGVNTYSTKYHMEFQMSSFNTTHDVFDAIDSIPYRPGSTNTAAALAIMHSVMFSIGKGDRPDVDNICILVTDSLSNINRKRTVPEAETARAKGIHMYALGIGGTGTQELSQIASKPTANNVFTEQNFAELDGIKHKIFDTFCGK